jgi:ubiquinone/menaquinone biosynthesis C-methylase UbiE
MDSKGIREFVRKRYAGIARGGSSCCGPAESGCGAGSADEVGKRLGYSAEQLGSAPEGANLGLGCGNPVALASLAKGETVLDLGSGAGFDCFLAAREVGPDGLVIGVDMTPEMVGKARENALRCGAANVEFRLGEIERLPVADATIDAILSNCVINLSPDKEAVFAEAFRVLKPGGRLMISDIVLEGDLPDPVLESVGAWTGCIAGAIRKEAYLELLSRAGFRDVRVVEESAFALSEAEAREYAEAFTGSIDLSGEAIRQAMRAVRSVRVFGEKPA